MYLCGKFRLCNLRMHFNQFDYFLPTFLPTFLPSFFWPLYRFLVLTIHSAKKKAFF